MDDKERYREYAKDIENYRNRLIDKHTMSWSKAMDLWADRLLKDCELYITLFGLLIAWLAFLYGDISWSYVKYIFIFDIVIIFIGILRAFQLRKVISRSIEDYYANNAAILSNEINTLDYDPPRDTELLLRKRSSESKKMIEIRKQNINLEVEKYKKEERKYFTQKRIIFGMYIVSFLIFLAILFI